VVTGFVTVAALAAAWYGATTGSGLIAPGRFPSPADVWDSLVQLSTTGYANGRIQDHVLQSLILVTVSFTVASGVGVALGLAMGWSRRVDAVVNPVFLLIRPIPPLAWIPLAILWLGLDNAAKVMVIFFAAFVPAVINTQAGVRSIEPAILEAARMLGTPPGRLVAEVLVPGAMPMIFTGLRLSLQASWTTLVAAELIGAVYGLGRVLNVAQQDIYPGMIFVGMLCVAVLGWATTRLLGFAESRALAWSPIMAAAR
jgi:NitT/TauT family transport system permease protein/taurine transport system permease protein